MKIKLLFLSFLGFLSVSCQGQPPKNVHTVDTKVFAQKLKGDKNAQLLDVRTPEEYKEGHIKNAANLDWYEDSFAVKAAKYDKSKPVYVYCQAGVRSAKAAKKLSEMGFQTIYNLDGGYSQWQKDKPVSK